MSSSLHPIERKVLSVLSSTGSMSFESLVGASSLQGDQVRRALQWLASKGLVSTQESVRSRLELVHDPPELELFEKVRGASNPLSIEELKGTFSSPQEFSAAFGRARGSGWIRVDEGAVPAVRVADAEGPEVIRSLLESISSGKLESELTAEQSAIVPDFVKRGILNRAETRSMTVGVTEAGRQASASASSADFLERHTPEVIASGSWRGKSLRPIDVEARPPRFYPGRRHPVRDFIKEVRETYVSMGFTEVQGNSAQPAFWNFDALFVPQNHPSREMQDTFYLDGMSDQTLSRTGAVARVAATHERGWKTGSRGWGYRWNIEEARRLVLRTHNTVLTVRALAEEREKERRVFAVSKVYRNENLDYKHLAEFYQMDGIMVGEGLNVRHLMGFLTEFYKKLGMSQVKLWPTFFPYTEPSLEVVGYSKAVDAWIELSGSGVFRPEVTVPLGVDVPVLAWGPGIERLMLIRYGLDDLRALYGGDLSWLRSRREIARS